MEPHFKNPFAEPEPSQEARDAQVVPLRPSDGDSAAPQRARTPGLVAVWYGSAVATAQRAFTGDTVFHDHLPSFADLWGELRTAPWAPADAGFLRFTGRVYRLLVTFPANLLAQPLLWVFNRPLRLFLAVATAAIAYVCVVVFG